MMKNYKKEEKLHFDNEKNRHISFKSYKKNDYGLLKIGFTYHMQYSFVYISRRSDCRAKVPLTISRNRRNIVKIKMHHISFGRQQCELYQNIHVTNTNRVYQYSCSLT